MRFLLLIACAAALSAAQVQPPAPAMPAVGEFVDGRCGAVLISDSLALTAAHCGLPTAVRFGDEVVGVSHSIAPGERWEYWKNDIAILFLERPVSTKPIHLAKQGMLPQHAGTSAALVGWARPSQRVDRVKLLAPVRGSDKICWAGPARLEPGDSGGAILVKGYLVGIATSSWSDLNYATETFLHLEWIRGYLDEPAE